MGAEEMVDGQLSSPASERRVDRTGSVVPVCPERREGGVRVCHHGPEVSGLTGVEVVGV
jgi:hypothetical protein